jgi:hypothetical protein
MAARTKIGQGMQGHEVQSRLNRIRIRRTRQLPEIAVLSATPQHSSGDKATDVAGAMRISSRCETESPALRDRCGFVRVIRNAHRHDPNGKPAVVADVAAKIWADGVKIGRRPSRRGHLQPMS